MATITIIECEEESHFFSFFNFVEYPSKVEEDGAPILYFSMGMKFKESGIGFMMNDFRLKNGVFQNPYHYTGKGCRAYGYMGEGLARLIQAVWNYFVVPQMPKWKLSPDAWKGLVFDEEKLEKAMHTPYRVYDPEKATAPKQRKGRKLNFA